MKFLPFALAALLEASRFSVGQAFRKCLGNSFFVRHAWSKDRILLMCRFLLVLADLGGIESFNLIDADSDTVFLGPLVLDQATDRYDITTPLSTSDISNYSVEANTVVFDTSFGTIKSVQLCVAGRCRCEGKAPWALFGDSPEGAFNGQPFKAGTYEITATPYKMSGCVDEFDDTKTLTFTVVDGTSPPTPAPVTPAPVDIYAHCEQPIDSLSYQIGIQELQSPAGPRHSDGILSFTSTSTGPGTDLGVVWFSNDIVLPKDGSQFGGDALGTQTGKFT